MRFIVGTPIEIQYFKEHIFACYRVGAHIFNYFNYE